MDEHVEALFWSNVDIRGPDECWPWKLTPDKHGNGEFRLDGKTCRAHRVAYLITFGEYPEPEGMHLCDDRYPPRDISYRLCCNPAHIQPATHAENMARMATTGRAPRGEFRRELSRATVPRGDAHFLRRHPEAIQRGEDRGNTKLTDEIVTNIFLNPQGLKGKQLAEKYGISQSIVSQIRSGKRWTHVTKLLTS